MWPLYSGIKGLECEAVILSRKNFMKTTNYAHQHLKLGSVQIKTRYDRLSSCSGYNEEEVWLYRPTRTKGKLHKLQSSWEGPHR
jgi:hypothetical protein